VVSDWEYKKKDIPEWEPVTEETELKDVPKKSEEQKQINDVIKITAEAKKRPKLKAFEGKRQQEGKKEKEEQKL